MIFTSDSLRGLSRVAWASRDREGEHLDRARREERIQRIQGINENLVARSDQGDRNRFSNDREQKEATRGQQRREGAALRRERSSETSRGFRDGSTVHYKLKRA